MTPLYHYTKEHPYIIENNSGVFRYWLEYEYPKGHRMLHQKKNKHGDFGRIIESRYYSYTACLYLHDDKVNISGISWDRHNSAQEILTFINDFPLAPIGGLTLHTSFMRALARHHLAVYKDRRVHTNSKLERLTKKVEEWNAVYSIIRPHIERQLKEGFK